MNDETLIDPKILESEAGIIYLCPNCGQAIGFKDLENDYIQDLEEELENLQEYNRVLIEKLKKMEAEAEYAGGDSERRCSECGQQMSQGYVIGDGLEYYCCIECLRRHYTDQEYSEMYKGGSAYWTEWEE